MKAWRSESPSTLRAVGDTRRCSRLCSDPAVPVKQPNLPRFAVFQASHFTSEADATAASHLRRLAEAGLSLSTSFVRQFVSSGGGARQDAGDPDVSLDEVFAVGFLETVRESIRQSVTPALASTSRGRSGCSDGQSEPRPRPWAVQGYDDYASWRALCPPTVVCKRSDVTTKERE